MSTRPSKKSDPPQNALTPNVLGRMVVGVLVAAVVSVVSVSRLPGFVSGRYQFLLDQFLTLFLQAVPFLLLGAFVAAVLDQLVSERLVQQLFTRSSVGSVGVGILLALVLPVGEFGAIPVVYQLLRKGAPLSGGLAFMCAAPAFNVISIVSTQIALGSDVLVSRLGLTLIMATVVGLLAGRWEAEAAVLPLAEPSPDSAYSTPVAHFWRVCRQAGDLFLLFGGYLVVGCLLGALAQSLLPATGLLQPAHGPVSVVMGFGTWGFLSSEHAVYDAHTLAALSRALPAGASLAYLVWGGVVDLTSLLMLSAVLRKRLLGLLMGCVAIMCILSALAFNMWMG